MSGCGRECPILGSPGPRTASRSVPDLGDAATVATTAEAADPYGPGMELGRRGLLGLGAAVALSAAGCRGADGEAPPTTQSQPPTMPPTATPTAAPTTPRFPGDPGPGKLYYGASVPHGLSVTDWETELGSTLAVHRSYFTPDHNEVAQLMDQCRDDIEQDRLPHVSIKPTWTWRSLAAGDHDGWINLTLRRLAEESVPIFLTIHHEPENDSGPEGMSSADYVAMQSRVIERAATLAPMVSIVPVLQHWTFDPLREADTGPADWIVPDASIIGVDIYNPWSATNGKRWRSFGSKAAEVLDWVGDKPLAIGEYGCRVDPTKPGLAAAWLHSAADFGRENGFVSMSYFNSHVNSPDGTWALDGETELAFAELLASDWVARPGAGGQDPIAR